MKRILLVVSCVTISLNGMSYRLANKDDVPALLELMNSQAVHDSDKIVIVPKKFREGCLVSSVEKGRMFVAEHNGEVIGYKKLFLIKDDEEKQSILEDEIRCCGSKSNQTYSGYIDGNDNYISSITSLLSSCCTTCLYNGGDFTHRHYRGKGINSHLTNAALYDIIPQVVKHQEMNGSDVVTMLYGLTEENAGKEPGMFPDRTVSISKSFKSFIKKMYKKDAPIKLEHSRYRAYMPTFDPESSVFQPLPDEKSIPGFGCVLVYVAGKHHE
jgi:hypothetical protein